MEKARIFTDNQVVELVDHLRVVYTAIARLREFFEGECLDDEACVVELEKSFNKCIDEFREFIA